MPNAKAPSAVDLLMKDLKPSTKDMPVEPIINAVERFNLQPVADVIVIEHRICQGCGSSHLIEAGKVHRLFSSCEGEPVKKVLRLRKPDEPPLDMRVFRIVEVPAAHCCHCWAPTHSWADALAVTPPKPVTINGQVYIGRDPDVLAAIKKAKSKSKYADFIAKSPYEQAKEL